jgi:putative transcriptional regulator
LEALVAKQRSCGGLLRDLRRRLGGVSQEKLASRVGVSWSTISRWENGKGTPSPLAREKLTTLLGEVGLQDRVEELDVGE